MDMIKNVPEDSILKRFNSSTLNEHKKRIIEAKKANKNLERVNYVDKLVKKEIDFNSFLIKQHNQKIKETDEQFLFTDIGIFRKVSKIINNRTGDLGKEKYDVSHEKQHLNKATAYNIETFFAIKFNVICHEGKQWNFKINPALIALVEKKALEEKWSISKYLKVVKDIANVLDMNQGDLKTLKSVKAIASSFNIDL